MSLCGPAERFREEVPEASAQDFQADLAGGNLLPEIEQALLGKQVDDSIRVDLPEGRVELVLLEIAYD